ncbi:transposase [Pelagicoccus sp. SDUM812002]|uniref:transposase n=1 Tax=Pelagicoccus sp. SDUM812002 TaxID=3041266 RepID=UPI0034E28D13
MVLGKFETAFGCIRKLWANEGDDGKFVQWVSEIPRHRKVELEIIRRSDKAEGFKLLPRRWVVERTFERLSQQGRLTVDRESKTCSSEVMIHSVVSLLFHCPVSCGNQTNFSTGPNSRSHPNKFQPRGCQLKSNASEKN